MRLEGWRKFSVTMLTIILSSVLCWFEKIDGTVYATIVTGVSGLFFTGNVISRIKGGGLGTTTGTS